MKKLNLLFILFFCCSLTAWGKSLNLESLDKRTQQELLVAVPALKGNEFSRGDLEAGIKWLISSGNFDSANYQSNDEDHFIIKVGKTKRVRSVIISGNKSVGDPEIRIAFGVSEQAVFDTEVLLDSGRRVQGLYRDQGFFKAVIDLEFIPVSKNEYDVNLKITENIQSKFKDLKAHTENTELEGKLNKIMDKLSGKPFTPTALKIMQKDIQNFFLNYHYFKAEADEPTVHFSEDESEVNVDIRVTHPELYIIEPTENKTARENFSDCADAIGLSQYHSTAPNLAQELTAKIRSYYVSQSYARVEVNVQERDGVQAFHRRLTIDIVEGPRVAIQKIEFTGRISKPEKYYVDKLYDLSTPIFAKKRFVKDDLDSALKSLVIDSQNNGYFKAKVVSVRTSYNATHDAISISINLDEGPLTQIQKISFDGIDQISEKELLDVLGLKPLDPLRLNILEAGIERIKKYYHDHGFLDMILVNELNDREQLVSYNEDNTLANLKFRIFEGPKVIVGTIVVEGNTITKDFVVLKELEFKQGDVLTPALIDESLARLQRVGVFSGVDIKTLEEKTLVSRRTVLVKVNDRNPGLVNAGIGYTNELGGTPRGFVGYSYRNIDGMARVFNARLDVDDNITNVNFFENKASISYLRPYLFDSRMRGRLTLTNATFIYDYNSLFAETVQQITFSLEQEITSHFLVRWDIPSWAKYNSFAINASTQASSLAASNVLIGSTGPTFELDYRDNPFHTTKGTFSKLGLEYAAPGILQSSPQVNFYRTVGSFSHTMTVYKGIVWANQVRGGYVKNIDDPGGYVPWTQKGFLLGGPTTIRGFTVAESFPNSKDLGLNLNYQLLHEASMYLVKSELRIPLKGNIGMLLFYDGGGVVLPEFNYGFGYRHSAGVGLLYDTPVGPAIFDVGWKLNELGSRGEAPLALDVSIGTF